MPESPELIIFDLGNVIVNIDHVAVAARLANASDDSRFHEPSVFLSTIRKRSTSLLVAFDEGRITPLAFYEEMASTYKLKLDFQEFVQLWNSGFNLYVEAIESMKREYGVDIKPEDSRRNIATLGVPLNHLVGRDFRVGEVTLRGIRLCEPCAHMAEMTHKEVLRGLVHRGGLRAQVLKSGMIRVGDTVEEG